MAFKESLKLKVKRKAHFKCCICETFEFLHVHHIIPQEERGPDTIDNAAPLCTRCHDTYGGNPEKRKWIRERRDFWYEFCENKLHNDDINKLEETYKIFEKMHSEHETRLKNVEQDINKLQETVVVLTKYNQELISSIQQTPTEGRPEIFAQIGSNASTISGTATAMTQLGRGVYANPTCPNCGSTIGLYVSNQDGPPLCPNCKTPMQ